MCLSACVRDMYSSNMRGLPDHCVSMFLQQRRERACAPWKMIVAAHSGVSALWRESRALALLSNACHFFEDYPPSPAFHPLFLILLDFSSPHCRKKDSGRMWKSPANGFFDKTKGRELHPADGMW